MNREGYPPRRILCYALQSQLRRGSREFRELPGWGAPAFRVECLERQCSRVAPSHASTAPCRRACCWPWEALPPASPSPDEAPSPMEILSPGAALAVASRTASAECRRQARRDQKGDSRRTRPGRQIGGDKVDHLAQCLRDWDAGTHMTRQEWARTCRRVVGQSAQVPARAAGKADRHLNPHRRRAAAPIRCLMASYVCISIISL